MISREKWQQPDGSEWHLYHLREGQLMLTSRGRELLHERPEVFDDVREYRRRVVERRMGDVAVEGSGANRSYFASGGNSDVYTLNEDMVIKEATNSQSLAYALERLDRTYSVIESGRVPRWIDMPIHYGLLSARGLARQYMLMQRIDGGITVEHVLHPEQLSDNEQAVVTREFGAVSGSDRDEIGERFLTAHDILHKAFVDEGLETRDYLTDWHEGNVLVERTRTPIAGSNFKLWVIDQ